MDRPYTGTEYLQRLNAIAAQSNSGKVLKTQLGHLVALSDRPLDDDDDLPGTVGATTAAFLSAATAHAAKAGVKDHCAIKACTKVIFQMLANPDNERAIASEGKFTKALSKGIHTVVDAGAVDDLFASRSVDVLAAALSKEGKTQSDVVDAIASLAVLLRASVATSGSSAVATQTSLKIAEFCNAVIVSTIFDKGKDQIKGGRPSKSAALKLVKALSAVTSLENFGYLGNALLNTAVMQLMISLVVACSRDEKTPLYALDPPQLEQVLSLEDADLFGALAAAAKKMAKNSKFVGSKAKLLQSSAMLAKELYAEVEGEDVVSFATERIVLYAGDGALLIEF
jgi:hypothetical protein